MNPEFAAFLRAQRHKRQFTQAEMATRTHISERTLRSWETGTASPRLWELERVLDALQLTPQEHTQMLAMLSTPRGMRHSRAGTHSLDVEAQEYGPLPSLGDLLQAMRLRHGLTLAQVAQVLKLTRSTILRWEATQTLPSSENLERVCALLQAYPEERAALSERQMQTWEGKSRLSLDECAEQVDNLDRVSGGLQTPLVDLRALALKRQLWLWIGETEEALRLLARVHVIHATWLDMHNRRTEAKACIQRSLHILQGRSASDMFWQAAVNQAAYFVSDDADGNMASIRLLKQWLPVFPRSLQATLWCDMALYVGKAQQQEAAIKYLKQARTVLPYSSNPQGITQHYYPLTCARVLLSANRPVEAMEWLPSIPDVTALPTSRAFYQLLWARTLLEAGEKDAAQRQMDELSALFAQYPQPSFEHRLTELSTRL